jgi:hypothetical protein
MRTLPIVVEILTSEEGCYDGQIAKVVDIKEDNMETDYRIQTGDGSEFWIPAENVKIVS